MQMGLRMRLVSNGYLPGKMLLISVVVIFIVSSLVSAREITDQDIALAVETELKNDEVVPVHLIYVGSIDGIVTLSGSVPNLLVKERATKVAETVKGVRSVVNRTKVRPVARADEQICDQVKRALFYDPVAELCEIEVKVSNGIVTLIGVVNSWQERQICSQVAKGVIGVRKLQNEITVQHQPNRSDGEIKAEIKRSLEWDVWVDSEFIEVEVNQGWVVLRGRVASAAEKSRALGDAWVGGVISVDTKDLKVVWLEPDPMRRRKEITTKTDGEVKKAIEDAFRYDPRLASFGVQVKVEDGLVTLTGTVDNLLARKAVEQDAKNTLGVWRVKNYLKVRPVTVPSDNEIKGMVEDALSTKPFAEGKDINVRVYYGKVYLDGAVDSLYEKSMVENVVFRVRGVVEVKNNLKAQFTFPEKEDWEIKEDIEYELWWSPFVNSDQVRVNVSDGVATLTGEVGSWRERNAATDNAYDGGAWKVRNLLKVEVGPKYYEPSW